MKTKKLRKAILIALAAGLMVPLASCGTMRGHWGVEGEIPSADGYYYGEGYNRPPKPPKKPKKPKKQKKNKHHDNGNHNGWWR